MKPQRKPFVVEATASKGARNFEILKKRKLARMLDLRPLSHFPSSVDAAKRDKPLAADIAAHLDHERQMRAWLKACQPAGSGLERA